MTRLADRLHGRLGRQQIEKICRNCALEYEAGWKLDQQNGELRPQTTDFIDKFRQRLAAVDQLAPVGDFLGKLDRKTKGRWNYLGPPGPSRLPVRPVKRRVYLHGAELRSVALQGSAFLAERTRRL